MSELGDPRDIFECLGCERVTTRQEATLRLYRTRACGHCGGRLVPQQNLRDAREGLRRAQERLRKVCES